jgi:Lon protease-like protein
MLIPDRAGVMILGEASLFPQAMLPLFIFEPRYRVMLSDSLESHRMFCLAMQRPDAKRESPCHVATLGLVRACVRNDNGTSNLVLHGLFRVQLGKIVQTRPYRKHLITPLVETSGSEHELGSLVTRTLDLVDARLRQDQPVPLELIRQLASGSSAGGDAQVEDCVRALKHIGDVGRFTDLIATLLLPNPLARQVILQTVDTGERLRHLVAFLAAEVARGARGEDKP